MKKKTVSSNDIPALMAQIQEQLAVLDRKLDQFMTKSLKDIAEALAASKPAQVVHVPAALPSAPRPVDHRPSRQMYAVVCFDCGKDTEIPFKPSGDRPVYCKECFAKRKSGQGSKSNVQARPNTSPSIQTKESAPVEVAPVEDKKKSKAVKKTVAKKKMPVKKQPKRK